MSSLVSFVCRNALIPMELYRKAIYHWRLSTAKKTRKWWYWGFLCSLSETEQTCVVLAKIFLPQNESLDSKITLDSHNLLNNLFTHRINKPNSAGTLSQRNLIMSSTWPHQSSDELTFFWNSASTLFICENKSIAMSECEYTHLPMSLSKLISNNSITNALSTRIEH